MSIKLEPGDVKMAIDVSADCVSAPRNILRAATNGTAAALPALLVAQGALAISAGAYTAVTSIRDGRKAYATNDHQGVARNSLGILIGTSQMTLGSAVATSGVGALTGNAIAIGAGVAINPALFAVYGFFIARASLAIHHAKQFEKNLATGDLEFKKFLSKKLKENPEHIKRILGESCFATIAKLANGENIDLGTLRQMITRECLKQKITNGSVIAISLLGIAATLAGILFASTCPALCSILFAIGAVLWIFVDCVPLHLRLREGLANKILRAPPLPTGAASQPRLTESLLTDTKALGLTETGVQAQEHVKKKHEYVERIARRLNAPLLTRIAG
jgi:hypothetical protein